MKEKYLLSQVRFVVCDLIRRVLDWMIDILIFTELGPAGNTALLLIYTHYSSPLHPH
jgi:hypothetical protein